MVAKQSGKPKPKGAFIYDVRKEERRGSLNAPKLQTNGICFAEKEGEGVNKFKNYMDVINGSPLT